MHPTWRVVEVVSTEDPEKWRKNVDQLQKLGIVVAEVLTGSCCYLFEHNARLDAAYKRVCVAVKFSVNLC